ncbi:MAG: T9SS type A sorting domain-containing protein [Ignavibacteria bacterium]
MKRNFSITVVAISLAIVSILGFTSNDPIQRDPNAVSRIMPSITRGPALNNPISTLNESFEGTTFPPAGWVRVSLFGNEGWNRQLAGTTPLPGWTGAGGITAPTGGGIASAYVTYGMVGVSNNEWLITPQITNVQPGDSLKFWLRYIVPGFADSISVKISTTAQTPAAMTIPLLNRRLSGPADTGWVQYGYNIGAVVPAGSNIYIGFQEHILDNFNDGSAISLDLVSVSGGVAPPACNYSWSAQTSGTTSQLYSVSAVSNLIGWAAGDAGTVRRTTDGGSTWGNGNPNPGVINGIIYNIFAWTANDAICTTSPAGTRIYKTTNGGTNWTETYTNAAGAAFINGLWMISPTEGYATGDPVSGVWEFLKTTDGGSSWAQVPSAPASSGDAGWNNAFQIIGTNIWWGSNGTKVYHSTNLGLNWTTGATTGTVSTYAVHYNSATNGLAVGTTVVKSTDGGTTYTAASPYGTAGNMNGLDGNGTDWWGIRTDASIYRTTNQGANWTTAYTQTGAVWADINFAVTAGCPQGWAVGAGGVIGKMVNTTGISNVGTEVPNDYLLKQNFPNPFNPTTNINFSIPKSGFVTLKIYDVVGKEVATLVNEVKGAGSYIVGFNASSLPSGAYFYRIESNSFVDTKKMLLIK